MKPGGGKQKGNAFEREVCTCLSRWVTNGAMTSIFTRNIISGGQFTNRMNADGLEAGMPGDIMARHPLAYSFLSKFLVECKSHKDLGIDTFVYDFKGTSSLAKIISKCRKEAGQAALRPMLVIKQNQRPPLLLLDEEEGLAALEAVAPRLRMTYHVLHARYFVFDFQTFRNLVSARRMLEALPLLAQD